MNMNTSAQNINLIAVDGGLVPAMPPVRLSEREWCFLCRFSHSNATNIELYTDGKTLGAVTYTTGQQPGEPYVVAEMAEPVTGAFLSENGMGLVTATGFHEADWDEAGLLRVKASVEPAQLPTPAVVTTTAATMHCPLPDVKTSRAYTSHDTTLAPSDLLSLGTLSCRALEGLFPRLMAEGYLYTPALVKYRLRGRAGRVLFESVPKMVYPVGASLVPDGLKGTFSTDGATLTGVGFNITPFKVAVRLPSTVGTPLPGAGEVAKLEVWMAVLPDGVQSDMPASGRVSAVGNTVSFSGSLPGCTAGESRATLLAIREASAAAVAGCEEASNELFKLVATIDDPWKAGQGERTIELPPLPSTRSEARRDVERAISACRAMKPLAEWEALYRLPHSCGATSLLADGDRLLLANPSVATSRGHSLSHYIIGGMGVDTLETVVTVTLDDGTRLVNHEEIRSYLSPVLSPVIMHPDPRAVSIEMQACGSTGRNLYFKAQLTPCGTAACYMTPDGKPVEMSRRDEDPEFYLPQPSPCRVTTFPGIIAMCEGATRRVTSTTRCGYEPVVGLWDLTKVRSGTIDTSRARYMAMSADGLFVLSTDSRSRLLSPGVLDRRSVLRSDAVTVRHSADGATLWAVAGGDLVRLSGNRVMTVMRGLSPLTAIAARPSRGDLLLVGDEEALSYHPEKGYLSRVTTLPTASCLASTHGVARLTGPTGHYDIDSTTPVAVACRLEMDVTPRRGRLEDVVVPLVASEASGRLLVYAVEGREPGKCHSSLLFQGRVERPLVHRVAMPRCRRAKAVLEATLSPDSMILTDE